MSKPSVLLSEPLTLNHETLSRGTWCSGKVLWVSSLFIGLAIGVLFSQEALSRSEVEEPSINMFGALPGSPASMSCPRPGGFTMSLDAMEDALKKYGIPSSPLARFGLAQYAASRDVSRAAQAREEFSRLDAVTQAKFKKLNNEVIARAASLKPEDMAGVTAPMDFFDPAGFTKDGDIAYLRTAELKHGRICMLSFLGVVVSEKFHPIFDAWGDGAFVSATASHFSKTAADNFWPAFWILNAFHEYLLELNKDPDALPGDYGFDPLKLKPTNRAEFIELQNKELNNGRLAMFAMAGIFAQEFVTGKKIF